MSKSQESRIEELEFTAKLLAESVSALLNVLSKFLTQTREMENAVAQGKRAVKHYEEQK